MSSPEKSPINKMEIRKYAYEKLRPLQNRPCLVLVFIEEVQAY